VSTPTLQCNPRGWDFSSTSVGLTGSIPNIPTIAGTIIATSETLCLIKRADGVIFTAHKEWFKKYKTISEPREKSTNPHSNPHSNTSKRLSKNAELREKVFADF
jgi:hypothetical protein